MELAHAASFQTIIVQNKNQPWSQKISDPPEGIQRHDSASNAAGAFMKRIIITLLISAAVPLLAQTKSIDTREILKLEDEFGRAMMKNDPEAIGRLLADDWIIIDPDGGIVDRARFLGVIRSGSLSHEVMDSRDVRVRIYGDSAAVTALATTTGKFTGQSFNTEERATDLWVKKNGRWMCVLSQLTRFTKK
jgi:ketosteroid isomerase-like protein